MSKAMTIAGGTSEVQLNVIANHVLQLPQPPKAATEY
jgi:acyl-CoA dehydrogenase